MDTGNSIEYDIKLYLVKKNKVNFKDVELKGLEILTTHRRRF